MVDKLVFAQQIKRLSGIYDKNWDQEKLSFKIKEYYDKLGNLSQEAFIEGIEKCILEFNRFPTIHEMKQQCQIVRGRKEAAKVSPVKCETDNSILDAFYDSLNSEERHDIKAFAFDLMKRARIVPTDYKKGSCINHDSMITSIFNCSFKYIVFRKHFKDECVKRGYKIQGECYHHLMKWVTFEQCFSC